jgi:metal-responsive CopG/Arc/MetJ family transcriptional regulator
MLYAMSIHIELDEALLEEAQNLAVRSSCSLVEVIESALREYLERHRKATAHQHTVLPTFGGDGLLPGVDLDNSAALLDLE